MTAPLPPLMVRMNAAQAVVDRFQGKPFQWGRDCITLGATTVRGMGYANPLKGAREYRGEIGALRALRVALTRVGADPAGGLPELLDAMGFERITPAAALPADLLGFPADPPWSMAIGVALDNARALAFTPNGICSIGDRTPALTAWRVEPCL